MQPPSRTTALLASLSQPSSTDLSDLSISRPASRLTWGIPVPSDPDHTIYVWIDALVNYLTVAGYPWQSEAVKQGGGGAKLWPPDLQVVGKDIVRFHALYLPAILMALDLELPRHLLTHGHWTMDRFKMSKSRGNVANPFDAMTTWSIDAVRMYLMAKGGNSATDNDYSEADVERFYKKELAGQMGNLLARVTGKKMLKKLGDEALLSTIPERFEPIDEELVQLLKGLPGQSSRARARVRPLDRTLILSLERQVVSSDTFRRSRCTVRSRSCSTRSRSRTDTSKRSRRGCRPRRLRT